MEELAFDVVAEIICAILIFSVTMFRILNAVPPPPLPKFLKSCYGPDASTFDVANSVYSNGWIKIHANIIAIAIKIESNFLFANKIRKWRYIEKPQMKH